MLVEAGHTVLVGFDFAYSYPRGTAEKLGLKEPLWREIWSLLSCKVQDNPNNKNNRFQVAADLNHKLSGGPFPFWNCPPSQASEFLTTKKSKSHADVDIPEFRNAEEHGPGAQPVW